MSPGPGAAGPGPSPGTSQLPDEIRVLHEEAMARGEATYRDPQTGYQVFTEWFLRERGYCCGSGCRHCPYPRP